MVDAISISPLNALPYLVLILVYILMAVTSGLTRIRFFHDTAVGLMICFAGLRDDITPDADRYRYFYEHYTDSNFQRLMEPSFFWISRVLNSIHLNYHAIFFLYTLITIVFIYAAVRNFTKHVITSMFLYLTIPHLFLGLFIEMRQDCAAAIVFYAMSLRRMEDVRFRTAKIAALAALSIAFHYSAALYWVVFLVMKKGVKRQFSFRTCLVALVGSLLVPPTLILRGLSLVLYPVLPAEYRAHVDELVQLGAALGAHSTSSLLIYNGLALVFCYARFVSKTISEDFSETVNLFAIGAIVLNVTRLYGDIARFADYFIIYEIVLLPLVLFNLKARELRPVIVYSTLVLYVIHFVHGLYYLNAETNSYILLHYSSAFLPRFVY